MDQLIRLQRHHNSVESPDTTEAPQSSGAKFESMKMRLYKKISIFLKYKSYSKINLFYNIHIGILGRYADNIYIYINVVNAYYTKENDGQWEFKFLNFSLQA